MRPALRLLASTAVLAVFGGAASAADYDPPIFIQQAPEYVPVEVGSGWYLRGDVAYTFDRRFRDTSVSIDDELFPNEWLGFGGGPPLELQGFSVDEFPVSASIGVGYHINDFLRTEINVGRLADDRYTIDGFVGARNSYLPPSLPDIGCLGTRTITETITSYDEEGNEVGSPSISSSEERTREGCHAGAEARNTAWNGMANAYVDLGTVAGFTPYIGAGVGLLHTKSTVSSYANCQPRSRSSPGDLIDGTRTTTDITFDCIGTSDETGYVEYEPVSYSHSDYNLLYSLSAGFAYQMTQNTKLDFGYQYSSAPSIDYVTTNEDGVHRQRGLDFHQVKVGLRYDLW